MKKEMYREAGDGHAAIVLAELEPYTRHHEFQPGFPGNSALLVLDMQRYFLDPSSHAYLPTGEAIVPAVNALASGFAAAGLPVFFSWHAYKKGEDAGALGRWWMDALDEKDPLAPLHPSIKVPVGAMHIRKTTYDMFDGTDLAEMLKEKGVRCVVAAGVMTHLCVETTARSAFVRGFDAVVPVDACATSNAELHLSALRTLADGFAVVCPSEEILSRLEKREGVG